MVEKHLGKAFRIIRRNYGGPGNDGISIRQIKNNYARHKAHLERLLIEGSYQFGIPREVIIQDYLGQKRTIFVYSVYDRWIQESIKLAIYPLAETLMPPYVFGSLRNRTSINAANYVMKFSPKLVLKLDISKFFFCIEKDNLISKLGQVGLNHLHIDLIQKSLSHSPQGLPPGNCLSPLLADIFLRDIDLCFPQLYARYADDMTFVISSEAESRAIILKVNMLLEKIGLRLNNNKTKIIHTPTIEDLL